MLRLLQLVCLLAVLVYSSALVDDDPTVDDDASGSGSLTGEVIRKGNGWTWYCFGKCSAPDWTTRQGAEPTPGFMLIGGGTGT